MTPREEEILRWIEENPLITQQELAQRAGITRASVGVHISNLMKKGNIVGKGYILQQKQCVCVVGAANIDICGTPFLSPVLRDSNPGKTTLSLGGVGRNIAENLSKLGVNTELITVLGEDSYSRDIMQNCKENAIGMRQTQIIPGEHTSTYVCLNDEKGDMQLAVSDMEIYHYMTPAFLNTKLETINRSAACVIDTNITMESLNFLMDNCRAPIFLDTVSLKKTQKLKSILHHVHTIKPNRIEAEMLSDMQIQNPQDLEYASEKILQMGVSQIFISLGSQGVYYSNGTQKGRIPCFTVPVVNTTGAGDSFLAATVWGYLRGMSVEAMAVAGLAAAAICVGSHSTVSQGMSCKKLEIMLDENTAMQE